MVNFKIEVELMGAEREEYGTLDVAMEARGFKTTDVEGRALPTGEYSYRCFAGQLSREMVDKAAREVVERVAKELGREWKVDVVEIGIHLDA